MGYELTFKELINILDCNLPIRYNRELRSDFYGVYYIKNNKLIEMFSRDEICNNDIYTDKFTKVLIDLMDLSTIADLVSILIDNNVLLLNKFSNKQQKLIKSALFLNALTKGV